MNKIYRDGIDVGVGFKSALRAPVNPANINASPVRDGYQPSFSQRFIRIVKQTVKSVLRFFYNMMKPILRPIAFRIRRYLFANIQTELENVKIQQIRTLAYLDWLHKKISGYSSSEITEVFGMENELAATVERIERYALQSAKRAAIYCNLNEILIRTTVGYVLCSPKDHAVLIDLIENGDVEPGTRQLIERFLSPGDTFVDVGAHLGLHTLAGALAVGREGRVIAFEPSDSTRTLLEKTITMNGHRDIVTVFPLAVSNSESMMTLHLGTLSTHHSLYPLEKLTSRETLEVRTTRLDTVLQHYQDVTLVKIDAEGAEMLVLEGMKQVINCYPDLALIVECGPDHIKRSGYTLDAWIGAFKSEGFMYMGINEQTSVLETCTIEELGKKDSVNLFFARKNSNAWDKARMAQ